VKIATVHDFVRALEEGPYAWPGGYPLFFTTSDGGALAFGTAWEERRLIAEAIRDKDRSGWRVVDVDVNWEDPELFDDHAGGRIESAYAEDDAKGDYIKMPKGYKEWRRRRLKKAG